MKCYGSRSLNANGASGAWRRYLNGFNRAGTNLDETLTGSPGNDRLKGYGGNDRLYGQYHLGGDDSLYEGGAGADRLNGGPGSDTADYAGSTDAGVTVDLRSTRAELQRGGHAQGDTLTGIENLSGSVLIMTTSSPAMPRSIMTGRQAGIIW